MKCSNRNLNEEQLFERVDKYLCGELSENEDRKFTEHIMECQACYEMLLIQQLTKRIVTEYEDQIFPEVKETHQETGTILTQEPTTHVPIATLWLMLNNAMMKEIKFKKGISWTAELPKPGLYSLITQDKQILYAFRKLLEAEKGVSVRGATDSMARPRIEVIEIPLPGEKGRGELEIRLEKKEQQLVLSLSVKALKAKP